MTNKKLKQIEAMKELELLLELFHPLAKVERNEEALNHVQVQLAQLTKLVIDLSAKLAIKTN